MDKKRKWENYIGMGPRQNHKVPVSAHEYEVFLSFMGEDTRRGFTDHLYQRMVDAGISVFKDNVDLPYGMEIAFCLSEAIKKSKIAMPILSKNYAASRWCLNELVCMLECRNTTNPTVLPIFYDVTPSQVRHQTGSYATAFADHVKKYDEETMEKWRRALAEVASLKGLELEKETGGHEGQLTKKILGKILVELKKTHLRVTDKLVGIDDQEKEVKDLLAIAAKDVRKVVGLWGMGGIGKTTLAKFIYNQILDKFESCSFLSDIWEKSLEHNGLTRLQSRLVSDLSKQERRDFSSVDEGVNELERRFREKKVLILLDDADHIDQLEALAAKINWFGPGSRIIVTTRNRSIMDELVGLEDVKDIIPQEIWWACYEVKEMNKDKALQLFCKHTFRQDGPEDEFNALSHAIVETTGGLPLALEVVGSFLSRKRKSIWEETLEKLRQMPKQEVQERLKISYERLDDDQKQMFLDVACLFIGEDIDVVMHVWKDRSFCAEIGKDVLLVMSLIKIVDNKIWMHDQLRDLGREIVRKENYKEPGKRSRLWQEDEARAALANNCMVYGSSEVEALHLHNDMKQDNCITNEQLRNYSNIWFLKLHCVNLTGDFRHLLSKLRWLRWQCPSEDCPTNLNLEKLLVLDLSFSCIRDDWKLWSSFQNSKKLKVLNLNSCSGLSTLDVSVFINLERLVLDNCRWLKEISVEGKLEKLIFLSMTNCWWVEKLSIWSLANLQILLMANCQSIKELPDSIGNLKSLTELDLSSTRFPTLPSSVWGLKNLQVLKIFDSRISCLPNAVISLEKLHLLDNSAFENLERNVSKEHWTLGASMYLKLVTSLNGSKALHTLNFSGDVKFHGRPQKLGVVLEGLEAVKRLNITGYNAFQKLPIPSNLKCLICLSFAYCVYLQEIEGLDRLEALQELNLSRCRAIEKLPSLSNLKSLKILNCSGSEKLRQIEGLDRLEALQELNLSRCRAIEKLPSLSNLKSLKILNCSGSEKLREIEGLDRLEALQELNLSRCSAIEKLPSLSKLKSLKILNCSGSEKLRGIEGIDQLEALQELNLSRCRAIEKLPSLFNLKSLEIWNCPGCEKLQNRKVHSRLGALERLNLDFCEVTGKFPGLYELKFLRSLHCQDCKILVPISGGMAMVPSHWLKYKEIHGNPQANNLCSIWQEGISPTFLDNEKKLLVHTGDSTTQGSNSEKSSNSTWMRFPLLFDAISKEVASKDMNEVYAHYKLFKKKKINREDFVQMLRLIVGDRILRSTLLKHQGKVRQVRRSTRNLTDPEKEQDC